MSEPKLEQCQQQDQNALTTLELSKLQPQSPPSDLIALQTENGTIPLPPKKKATRKPKSKSKKRKASPSPISRYLEDEARVIPNKSLNTLKSVQRRLPKFLEVLRQEINATRNSLLLMLFKQVESTGTTLLISLEPLINMTIPEVEWMPSESK